MTGWFRAQVNECERILKLVGLFESSNKWVTYSSDLPSQVRDLSYVQEYEFYQRERLFDLALINGAILQFKEFPSGEFSYCFYEIPLDVPTYLDFVADMVGDEIAVDSIGDEFREDYELAVQTASLRDAVTPIRYDFSPALYEAGVHPAGHVHVGSGNEVRLATRREMKPVSFLLFVIRQLYPDSWRELMESEEIDVICRLVRDDLTPIDARYFGHPDKRQLVLE